MTLSCIIVDDEPYAIQLLAQHISKISSLQLEFQCSNPLEALEYLKHHKVDLIFLDINMPHLNGLQFSAIFPPEQKFIFTTAYSEYAVESYERNTIDYLLKPITFERFLKAATKATGYFNELKQPAEQAGREDTIFLKSGKSLLQLSLRDVLLVEGQKDYAVFHTALQKHMTLKTLKELEKTLPPEFQRVHHSYIVNTRHIAKVEDNHVHILHHRIPVSEKYRGQFTAVLYGKLL